MGRPKYDKFLGRIREKDSSKQFIQELIDNSYIDFSHITGDPTANTELMNLINSFIDLLKLNTWEANQLITQAMIDYFTSLATALTNIINDLTTDGTANNAYLIYLNSLLTDLKNFIATLVIGGTFTQVMKAYIDNLLTTIKLALEQFIATTINNDLRDYILSLINEGNLFANSTRLISGSVTWLQNLDFLVSPLVYEILGKRLESPENLVTIPANVSALPMFAVIYADIFGNTGYILGVPAADPAVPIVVPATQLLITPVYIAGLGTVPTPDPGGETSAIVTEQIYDENIEWTTAKVVDANSTIDLVSILDPSKNTKHIRIAFAEPIGGAWLTDRLIVSTLSLHKDISVTVAANDFTLLLTDLSPYHKTDTFLGIERKISWFNWQNLNAVNVYLINKADNSRIQLKANNTFTKETWEIAELDFSVKIPLNFVAVPLYAAVPVGEYVISIEGLTSYDQYFLQPTGETFNPVNAAISFTRSAPIEARTGNIIFSLQPSATLFANSGLILELFNGAAKVGIITLLPGAYGFNPVLTDYQRLTIPVAAFNPTSTVITALVVRPVNAWPNNSTLDIDNIVLQTGIGTPGTGEAPKIEDLTFDYRYAALNNIYEIDPLASFAYKIISLVIKTDAGTVTAEIAINATPVTGLAAAAATAAIAVIPATAANLVKQNDIVKLTIAALSTATAINGKLRIIRT